MKKKIRFVKEYTHQERKYASGQEVEFDASVADSFVNLGLAEEVRAVEDEDDELDEALIGRIAGEAVRTALAGQNPQPTNPPNVTQPGERGVVVHGDRVPDHRRRTVRYIRATMLASSDDMQERRAASRTVSELARQVLQMPEEQMTAEARAAQEVIDTSGLGTRSKLRIRHILGDYQEGLRTLRSQERTMSTLTDAAGGYLLPEPFIAELFVFIEQYGYARRIMRFIPMTSKDLKFRDVATKPVAAWYGELDRILASDMAFGEGSLTASKLAGITTFSRELEEDAMIALLPLYTELMGEAIAQKEDLAAIRGDGTATYGSQRGVLDLDGAGEATVNTLGAGKTGFNDVTIEDLITIKNSISRARRRNASWLLPESTVTGLITLKRNNEANNYVLLDPNNSAGVARLLGYPLVDPEGVDDDLFPTEAVSTVFGAFGDFNRSLFGQRRGMTIETSREAVLTDGAGAVTLNAFQQDAVLVKATERIAIGHPQPDAYALIKTAAA